jgi:hypothetical protein
VDIITIRLKVILFKFSEFLLGMITLKRIKEEDEYEKNYIKSKVKQKTLFCMVKPYLELQKI